MRQQFEAQTLDDERETDIRWLSTTDPSINHHAAYQNCNQRRGNGYSMEPSSKNGRSHRIHCCGFMAYVSISYFFAVNHDLNCTADSGKTILR
jgi:hypothetical protein